LIDVTRSIIKPQGWSRFQLSLTPFLLSSEFIEDHIVGPYRYWLIGVVAHHPVITLHVRKWQPYLQNEAIVTENIATLKLLDGSVDMATTMHTIEHFGLGRYGDKFDLHADTKAMEQIIRNIQPGGLFIFSVSVIKGKPCLAFN